MIRHVKMEKKRVNYTSLVSSLSIEKKLYLNFYQAFFSENKIRLFYITSLECLGTFLIYYMYVVLNNAITDSQEFRVN